MRIVLAALLTFAFARAQTIRNDTFEVTINDGTFTISERFATIVRNGTLRARGSVRVVASTDRTFGTGQALEVTYANGDTDSILLFPRIPFVLLRSTIHNGSTE